MKPNPQQRLLKKFRKDLGVSLAELAKQAKLSEAMLSRFEAGNRKLSPEAYTRVLQAMTDLITEASAKRSAEVAKAKETATKLGVAASAMRGLIGVLGLHPLKSDKQIAKAELQKEREILDLLSAETRAQLPKLEKKIKNDVLAHIRKNPEKAAREYFALMEWRQKILDMEAKGLLVKPKSVEEEVFELDAQGYAVITKDMEQERKQLKARLAELEQELKAWQELQESSTGRIAGLEQELARERANKERGGVTITPDAEMKEGGR